MPSLLKPASRVAGRRVAPALIAFDVVRAGRNHWKAQLTDRQRRRLVELLKESHGDPRNLSAKQRSEVTSLIGDLDLRGFAKVATTAAIGVKSKKRPAKR